MKELVLVSCSGGMDSSTTLSILKLAEYENIVAVHFKYGHRGEECEVQAIESICAALEIPIVIFDLSENYKAMGADRVSMLADKSAKIITGTEAGLKSTAAWHPARNLLFMNYMIALAESEIMQHHYDTVYLTGGFFQLTESATYPDNTSYFVDACLNAAKYGTLIGNRLKPLYCLCNLMKSEQYALIEAFHLFNVYKHTISCDRPKLVEKNGFMIPCNCSKNGMPACGSGLLSYWAGQMVGVNDMNERNFYEVDDEEYIAYRPPHLNVAQRQFDIEKIIDRIKLPKSRLDILKKKLV